MSRTLTTAEVAECARLRKAGRTWTEIGRLYGVSYCHLRGALDPKWAAARREASRQARWQREAEQRRTMKRGKAFREFERPTARADAERLMQDIPPDTRDLTGILLGDPLPGRRAIDMRQGA